MRGLNLKLKKDAICCIYNTFLDASNSFKESDVLQGMGRACRAQGQGQGTIYMIGDPRGTVSAWDQVKARTALQIDDGGKNLRRLLEVSNKLKEQDLKCIKPVFACKEIWQKDQAEFSQQCSSVHKLFKKKKTQIKEKKE